VGAGSTEAAAEQSGAADQLRRVLNAAVSHGTTAGDEP
jgi:hypothetical protein